MPEQTECTFERDRKDHCAPQAKPDFREPRHALRVRGPGEIGGVHRADRRANHEIRLHSFGYQYTQHADLDRAEASAAGKHECRLLSSPRHSSSFRIFDPRTEITSLLRLVCCSSFTRL